MAIVLVIIMLVNESVNAKNGSAVTISGGSYTNGFQVSLTQSKRKEGGYKPYEFGSLLLYAYMRHVKLCFLVTRA